MVKVAFLGGGSFATALANLMGSKRMNVSMWARSEKVVNDINENRRNTKYLDGAIINENVYATCSISEALKDADYVVVAVASSAVREVCRKASPFITVHTKIINVAKGIESGTYKLMTDVIREEIPQGEIGVLSGPSHAEEVIKEMPTTVVACFENIKTAEEIQELFMTPFFRVYTNSDLTGVEVGGAVKNIIAFAAGVSDGIGYGDNAKAALMTRGMSEIVRAGEAMGGKIETFFGLTGIGDLIVTCTSMHSRNRRAGILVGKGVAPCEAVREIGMVVEGINACKAFYSLSIEKDISMPITTALYEVIFKDKDPRKAVMELMMRDRKSEAF